MIVSNASIILFQLTPYTKEYTTLKLKACCHYAILRH